MLGILKQSFFFGFVFPAILFRNQKSVTHVQSVWLDLDSSKRASPESLPLGADRARLARRTLQPRTGRRLPEKTVLQLQSLWTTHAFWHMELLLKPELQLPALQRFRLLRGDVRKPGRRECAFICNGGKCEYSSFFYVCCCAKFLDFVVYFSRRFASLTIENKKKSFVLDFVLWIQWFEFLRPHLPQICFIQH